LQLGDRVTEDQVRDQLKVQSHLTFEDLFVVLFFLHPQSHLADGTPHARQFILTLYEEMFEA